jgi:uncharacterized surface protein with fasciclin (FAS1) repeats
MSLKSLKLLASAAAATLVLSSASFAQTIVDVAAGNPQFSTLVTAVKTAGLVETLSGKGPFTVFAPTNDAFAKLPAGTLDGLLKDPAKLRAILTYHVLPSAVKAADVKTGSAKTANGASMAVKAEGGKVMVDNAQVITADVMASNGVIHAIDSVILPK